jgi:hypothetical protein
VFCRADGARLSHSEVKSVVPNACRRAGLAKRLTTHGLPGLICIYHPRGANEVDDLWAACTLAHEIGHAVSHERDEQSDRYLTAILHERKTWAAALSDSEKREILVEEERAWAYGRAELKHLGFMYWEYFEALRGKSLAAYRDQLGVER